MQRARFTVPEEVQGLITLAQKLDRAMHAAMHTHYPLGALVMAPGKRMGRVVGHVEPDKVLVKLSTATTDDETLAVNVKKLKVKTAA